LSNWKDNLSRIWQRARSALPGWHSVDAPESSDSSKEAGDRHLLQATTSLRELLADTDIPEEVRADLEADYRQVEAMCDKVANGHLHIAAFGRVSTGKSSLLNALVGEQRFTVSPLHGATRRTEIAAWRESETGGVHLIDTPGIDELSGETREKAAFDAAARCDLVVFVTDSDLIESEVAALRELASQQRPLVLALNKSDRYTRNEQEQLLDALRKHAHGMVAPDNVVAVSADPRAVRVVRVGADGQETEHEEPQNPDVSALSERIWHILDAEGKTLAALNAALFAGRLSDEVATRIAAVRRQLADEVTRTYSLTKGVAVALNPVPVADLLAAAGIDVALVTHLSRVYGMPMGRREAGRLLGTIVAQLALLMGAVWGVHLASSALKGVSAGLSVTVTAGAQGALAYYATVLVGRAAERYLRQGKSWGEHGPKRVVEDILESVDRNSILREARQDILGRLRGDATG
jgi:small GTP-binding protein